jgi:hypothetical protein
MVGRKHEGIEPELARCTFPLRMDMDWLVTVKAVEEETIRPATPLMVGMRARE